MRSKITLIGIVKSNDITYIGFYHPGSPAKTLHYHDNPTQSSLDRLNRVIAYNNLTAQVYPFKDRLSVHIYPNYKKG